MRITTAPITAEEDQASRLRRYLVSMAIRTACVVGLFVVPSGWPQALCLAGAVILPYVAVVGANVPRARPGEALPEVWDHREIDAPAVRPSSES